ncbi:MAG: protein TolR [Sphingomonadales bacterium]|nr:protein TolR [Sphingomonadales bacterium]
MAMGIHRSGGRGRGGTRRAPMAEINVTPLVDVMLVLLIIFMITAPLLVAGVPVNLPDSRAKPIGQEEREPVQISVIGDGSVYIDDAQVAAGAVTASIEQLARRLGDDPPQILLRADRDLDYGAVMRVMGELNRVGLNRVSLVTTGSAGEP